MNRDEAMRAAAANAPAVNRWLFERGPCALPSDFATAGADAELARVVEYLASCERVERNPDGTLDEVVTMGGAHLEQMSKKGWFLECTRVDGTSIAIWFTGKITMTEEREPTRWTLANHVHWKETDRG